MACFRTLALVALASAVSLPSARPAHADVGACIAANEAEVALRKVGKLHQALEQLTVCAAPSCPGEIAKECKRRIGLLNAAQPTIVVGATDGAGNDLSAVTVTVDGQPFLSKLDGLAANVDPGNHTLHFESAGNPPLDKPVVIQEGEKDRRIRVVLGAPKPKEEVAIAPTSTWSTRKTLAVTSAGVGVAGLVVGSVFGILSFGQVSTAKSDCPAGNCTAAGHASAENERSTAATSGTVSTIGIIGGAVLLATGGALWFTAPKSEATKPAALGLTTFKIDPEVTPRGAALSLSGRFW